MKYGYRYNLSMTIIAGGIFTYKSQCGAVCVIFRQFNAIWLFPFGEELIARHLECIKRPSRLDISLTVYVCFQRASLSSFFFSVLQFYDLLMSLQPWSL